MKKDSNDGDGKVGKPTKKRAKHEPVDHALAYLFQAKPGAISASLHLKPGGDELKMRPGNSGIHARTISKILGLRDGIRIDPGILNLQGHKTLRGLRESLTRHVERRLESQKRQKPLI